MIQIICKQQWINFRSSIFRVISFKRKPAIAVTCLINGRCSLGFSCIGRYIINVKNRKFRKVKVDTK